MIKIFVLIFGFGLSTLTTLLLKLDQAWKVTLSIIGFALAYIFIFVAAIFISAWFLSLPIDEHKTPRKYDECYRQHYRRYVSLAMSLFGVKVTVNGLGILPKDTKFLLAQNHLSNIDPMLTDNVLKKYPLIFVSKESLFHIPFWGKFIFKAGYVKLKRTSCVEDALELARGTDWLGRDECSIGLYPEGTRNKDYPKEQLLLFHPKSFEIARNAKKPIVVSVIRGTESINHLLLLKVHNIRIDFLKVITPSEYENLSDNELVSLVRSIMEQGLANNDKTKEYTRLY